MSRPYLVVGGDGLIGRGLVRALRDRGLPVAQTTRRPMDGAGGVYLDLAAPGPDLPVTPSIALLCAAVTSIKACADDPAATRRINVDNTARLAERLLRTGARVVFLSTNAVFDGSRPHARADAQVCPEVEYGRQKAEAERAILGMGPGAAVVRLTKVFSGETPLVAGWICALRKGEAIRPFSDLPVCPVSLGYAVDALLAIGQATQDGVFHVSGERDVSYAEFAAALANALGADPGLVLPVLKSESGSVLAYTPAHTSLDMGGLPPGLGLRPQGLADVASALAQPFVS